MPERATPVVEAEVEAPPPPPAPPATPVVEVEAPPPPPAPPATPVVEVEAPPPAPATPVVEVEAPPPPPAPPTTPAPPRATQHEHWPDESFVARPPAAAHSVFDLLSDYRVDGAPERTLPATPSPAPGTPRDVAVEDAGEPVEVTGRTRSRLLRRRPVTSKQRTDDALADLRGEVAALRRALEPHVAETDESTGVATAATAAEPTVDLVPPAPLESGAAIDFRLHFAAS